MGTLIAAPFFVSFVVGAAALLWCRGVFPLTVTTLGVGLIWALV